MAEPLAADIRSQPIVPTCTSGPVASTTPTASSGNAATDFIARCPECGLDSDIRRVPPPNIPWWHTFAAIGAGMVVTYGGFFARVLAERWGQVSIGRTNLSMAVLGCALLATGATVAIAVLAKDYRERWAFKYGRGKAPPRAWGLLLVDWLFAAIFIGVFPGLVFIALWKLFGY